MTMAPRGYDVFSTLNPQQSQIFDMLSQMLSQRAGGKEDRSVFEAPYLRQFQEQTIPGLAERFAGMGAGGQSSSAFRQALGGAGADLSERLAQIGAQREEGALSGLQSLLGVNTQGLIPKEKPFWQQLLVALAGGAGQGLSSLLTGGLSSLANLGGGGGMKQGTFSSIRPESYGQVFSPGRF